MSSSMPSVSLIILCGQMIIQQQVNGEKSGLMKSSTCKISSCISYLGSYEHEIHIPPCRMIPVPGKLGRIP